jgi:N-acetylneuraminic acid mutarotase
MEARSTRVGSYAYLAGGFATTPGPLRGRRDFMRLDLTSGRYTRLADLPEPLSHVGIAADGDDLYVIGGTNLYLGRRYRPTRSAWRYRIRTGRWEPIASLPSPRAGHGTAAVDGRLYVVGGRTDPRRPLASVLAYDSTMRRWSRRAELPRAADHLGVASLDGRIYAAGGRREDGGAAYREFHVYDPSSDRWSELPSLPEPTSGAQLVAVGRELVLSGGESPARRITTGSVWAYAPGTRSWRRLPSLPSPTHAHASVGGSDRLYVFGGSTCYGWGPVRSVESLHITRRSG